MPATSRFYNFIGDLRRLSEKMPHQTDADFFNVYTEIKKRTNIVQVVGLSYDNPSLLEDDKTGNLGKERRQKNKIYTWVKNSLRSASFLQPREKAEISIKEKWTSFADANENFVLQYIRDRPELLAKLQSDESSVENNPTSGDESSVENNPTSGDESSVENNPTSGDQNFPHANMDVPDDSIQVIAEKRSTLPKQFVRPKRLRLRTEIN